MERATYDTIADQKDPMKKDSINPVISRLNFKNKIIQLNQLDIVRVENIETSNQSGDATEKISNRSVKN